MVGGAGSQANPSAVQAWNSQHRDALALSNAFVAQAQDGDVKPRVLEHLDPRYHQAIASGDEQEAQRIKESWELIEPWIPVLGAGIEAYEGFEEGRYAKGVLNTGLAATEVLGIGYLKKLASLGAKKALNQSIKQLFKKEAVRQVEKVGMKNVSSKSLSQFNDVESLISSNAFEKLSRSNQVLQTTIKGNGEAIFKTLTQGGTIRANRSIILADGTIITKHVSKRTGVFTLDINKKGQLYKVRIKP